MRNRLYTKDFTFLSMKINYEQKVKHNTIGNEQDNAYIIYDNKTPLSERLKY